jgi:hypothetical protein
MILKPKFPTLFFLKANSKSKNFLPYEICMFLQKNRNFSRIFGFYTEPKFISGIPGTGTGTEWRKVGSGYGHNDFGKCLMRIRQGRKTIALTYAFK